MHENSIKSFHEIDRVSRRAAVLDVYRRWGEPLTDRKVAELMGFEDMNLARPRITELIDMGYLKECGNIRDEKTNKTVRLVRLRRPEENTQGELF